MKCLACGEPIAACLERAGSVRCHECRDADAPLSSVLVEQEEQPMLSYSDGTFVYEFEESDRESFLSDLGKSLFGHRSYTAIAEGMHNHFVSECPGEVPMVFDGMLLSKGEIAVRQWRAEMDQKAVERAKRQERAAWRDASPMAEALRKAGLAA